MAPVLGGQLRNEGWLPTGHETVDPIQRAKARESGVGEPKDPIAVVGHFMDLDIARDQIGPGHKAGVDLAHRLLFFANGGHISKLGNVAGGTDGKAVTCPRHSHGGVK